MYMINSQNSFSGNMRRAHQNAGDRSPYNPVIVLRRPSDGSEDTRERNFYELYCDDGGGSGLRPQPPSISEFLLGSGFDSLPDQLSHIEINGIGSLDHPPASKAAIELMPVVEISADHITSELYCAVCKEVFEVGVMPERCHVSISAFEMPMDDDESSREDSSGRAGEKERRVLDERVYDEDESGSTNYINNTVGLTIWRLPGSGFAVGRFSGGQRIRERELPVVCTEMDGGFNNGSVPRRISWAVRGTGGRGSGGLLRRVFRNLFGCVGGGRRAIGTNLSSGASSSSGPGSDIRTRRGRLFYMGTSSSSRRRRELALVADDGTI